MRRGFPIIAVVFLNMCATTYPESGIPDEPIIASGHISEVKASNYEQLPSPESPLNFQWDFAREETHAYTLSQINDNVSRMHAQDSDEVARTTGTGILEIKSQGDGTAKVVLREMKVSLKHDDGEVPDDQMRDFKSPPIVVQGMQEDGTFPSSQTRVDALFRLLFPLPDEPLLVGESVIQHFQFPVNAMGSPLSAEGRVTVRFSGLVYIRGRECAQLDTSIEIDDVEIPEEIEGTLHVRGSGEGRLFFDVEAHRLHEATVAFVVSMETAFPRPEGWDAIGEEEDPGVMEMRMTSDSLVKLTAD